MPFIGSGKSLLTTDADKHPYWWGTIVQEGTNSAFGVGPAVHKEGAFPSTHMYYWMREDQGNFDAGHVNNACYLMRIL